MTRPPTRSWPFVGRAAVVDDVRAALADPEVPAVVVSAPAGTGKTELVRVSTSAEAVPPLWWHGSPATAAVPFGALADLLDLDDDPDPSTAFRRVAVMTADAGGIVVVDDAPHLDPRSADLLHRLVSAGKATVAATARSTDPIPAWLEWLWLGADTRHLTLDPLDASEVTELVDLVAADLGTDDRHRLTVSLQRRTGGNALLVRELLAEAVSQVDRGVPLEPGSAPPPHLLRVLEARLGADAPEVAEVLCSVSTIGALPLDLAVAAHGAPAVDRAERAGWVQVDPGPRPLLRPTHPLYAEAVLATTGPGTIRQTAQRVGTLVLADPASTPTERLAATAALLDHGGELDPTHLLEAARTAFAALDHELAIRLAELALASGDDPEAQIVLGAALSGADRPADAERALRRAEAGATDDRTRARAAGRLAVHLVAHGNRIDDAEAVLDAAAAAIADPDARAFLAADRAKLASIRGDLRAVGDPLDHLDDADEVAVLNASIVGAYARAMAGDPSGCRAVIARALPLAEAHRAVLPWSGELVRFSGVFAALAADGPMAAASEAEDGLRRALVDSEATVGTWRYLTGFATAVAGHLDRALVLLEQAADELEGHDLINARPLAVAGRAWVLAQVERTNEARDLIDEVADAADLDARVRIQVAVADAWCEAAEQDGATAAAVDRLVAAAQEAATGGQLLSAALVLHDLTRLGAAAAGAPQVGALTRTDPRPWLFDHIVRRATAGDDDAALARLAADAHQRWPVEVAELEARRARAASTAGDPGAAARHAARAAAAAGDLGSLRPLTLRAVPTTLTTRELEVARAVASGATNREVADQAGVSVRTVENQLQSTYRKLGLDGRRALVDLFSSIP